MIKSIKTIYRISKQTYGDLSQYHLYSRMSDMPDEARFWNYMWTSSDLTKLEAAVNSYLLEQSNSTIVRTYE